MIMFMKVVISDFSKIRPTYLLPNIASLISEHEQPEDTKHLVSSGLSEPELEVVRVQDLVDHLLSS